MRRHFVFLIIAGTLCTRSGAASANRGIEDSPEQPNVLILFTDDQMYAMLGSESGGVVQTPNLDRFAEQGVRFTHFAANHPLCTPSRSTLLTGQYSVVHGSQINNVRLDPPNTTYLAEVFQRAGYRTGYIGKWHIDGGRDQFGNPSLLFSPREQSYVPPDRRKGFEEYLGYECCQWHNLSFFWDDSMTPPQLTFLPEFGWELQFQRAALRDFVERQTAANQPWMYEVSIGPPHKPDLAPPEFMAMYDPATIPLPPWMPPNLTPEQESYARTILQVHYAAVSFVDDEVGRILSDLDELGVTDNTIVIFASDNGNYLGSHWGDFFDFDPFYFQGKGQAVSNAIRVPLMMRWPGHIPANTKVSALMGMVDLAPTILSLAGLPAPWRMQGTDMSAWALGERGPWQPAIWLNINTFFRGQWIGLWDGDYIYSELDTRHLYDLRRDPYETQNVIDRRDYRTTQQRLGELLVSLTVNAYNPPAFPDIGAAADDAEIEMDGLIRPDREPVVIDGMPIRAHIALAIGAGGALNMDEILRDSLLSAYALNLDAFDRNDFQRARRFRALLTIGLSASTELQSFLLEAISAHLGGPLAGEYVSVQCESAGACFPSDPFTPPDAARAVTRATEEPLAGSGDADLDGYTNAEEYANAMAAGSDLRGFVRAALDPELNGTEFQASGSCFIATAAYGTPLASELDRLRSIRDRRLLPNAGGAAFADAYYRLSPAVAAWIAREPVAASVVRAGLGAILAIDASRAAGIVVALVGAIVLAARRQRTVRLRDRATR